MKAILSLLLLSCILYLMSVPVQYLQNDFNSWSDGSIQAFNVPGKSAPDLSSMTVMPYPGFSNPSRFWRLRQAVENSMIGGNPDYQADYYYNSAISDRIDSILVAIRFYSTSPWTPSHKICFNYMPNTSILLNYCWYSLENRIPSLVLNIDFVYNQDLVCTDGYQTLYYSDINALEQVKRLHVIYEDGNISSVYWWSYNHYSHFSYITRDTYEFDNLGRVSVLKQTASTDSVNWENIYRTTYQYHAHDNSTNAGFYESYAHPGNPFPSKYLPLSTSAWGMLSEKLVEYWNGTDWVNSDKVNYIYNASDQVIFILTMFYTSDGWLNDLRYQQTYDSNNLPTFLEINGWYEVLHGWSLHYTQSEFYWERVLCNEVSAAPPSLSFSVSPNPFRDKVSLNLVDKKDSPVQVDIYNLKGQLVSSFNSFQDKALIWNGTNEQGSPVAAGIYLIKVKQGSEQVTAKLLKLQ